MKVIASSTSSASVVARILVETVFWLKKVMGLQVKVIQAKVVHWQKAVEMESMHTPR